MYMKKFACKHCGKKFESGQRLGGHTIWCKKNPNQKSPSNWNKGTRNPPHQKRVICTKCGKEFSSMGLGTHMWRMHGKGKDFDPNAGYKKGSRKIWNKGLTKETSETVKRAANTLSRKIRDGEIQAGMTGKKHTEATRKKLSKNSGGYRYGSGRGKHGRYQGHACDSTWELAWIIHAIENNIKFKRNTKKFLYEWQGKTHKYIPDFDLGDHYIEVKGWVTEQTKAKLQAKLDKPVIIMGKKEIQPLLNELIAKHGKDLTILYDKKRKKSTPR